MPTNYGMLNNIAGGIREGLITYQTMKNQQRQEQLLENQLESQEKDRAMKADAQAMQAAHQGLIKGSSGYELSPEKRSEMDLNRRYKEALIQKALRGDAKKELGLTPGEEAADKAYGKDFADYEAGGGRASVEKNLGLLRGAIEEMRGRGAKDRAGGTSGLFGNTAMDVFNPEASSTRDKIYGAIQGTLKQVLGGQYTEREGQAIFNRAYNPRLSNEENIRRAEAELNALQAMADQKESSGKHFARTGTLKGQKKSFGLLPSANAGTSPEKIRVSNGKESFEIDASDLKDAEKDGFKRVK